MKVHYNEGNEMPEMEVVFDSIQVPRKSSINFNIEQNRKKTFPVWGKAEKEWQENENTRDVMRSNRIAKIAF